LSSALLACGAAFSGGAVLDFIHWSGASRVSFAVSAIVVASAILTAHLVVHNAVAVMFPAWVRIGARAAVCWIDLRSSRVAAEQSACSMRHRTESP